MRRTRLRLATAVAVAAIPGLALAVADPAVDEAQTAAAARIIDTGIPPQCSGTDSYCFSPNTVTVAAGGTVTWTSSSGTTHTVSADDGSWGSGDLSSGGVFRHTFGAPGTFTYHCYYHSYMKATVTVKGSAPGSTSQGNPTTPPPTHAATSTAPPAATSSSHSTQSTPPPAATSSSATSAPVTNAGGANSGGGPSPSASADTGALADTGGSGPSSGGSGGKVALIVVLVIAVLGGGAVVLRRRGAT